MVFENCFPYHNLHQSLTIQFLFFSSKGFQNGSVLFFIIGSLLFYDWSTYQKTRWPKWKPTWEKKCWIFSRATSRAQIKTRFGRKLNFISDYSLWFGHAAWIIPSKRVKKSRDILTMNFYNKNSNKIFSWCI